MGRALTHTQLPVATRQQPSWYSAKARQCAAVRAADVIVVVSGTDGALPSVVAGLVEAPVIAVPTSVGYGAALQVPRPPASHMRGTLPCPQFRLGLASMVRHGLCPSRVMGLPCTASKITIWRERPLLGRSAGVVHVGMRTLHVAPKQAQETSGIWMCLRCDCVVWV